MEMVFSYCFVVLLLLGMMLDVKISWLLPISADHIHIFSTIKDSFRFFLPYSPIYPVKIHTIQIWLI